MTIDIDGAPSYDWEAVDINNVFIPQDICILEVLIDIDPGGFSFFPPNIGPFNISSFTGCNYSSDAKSIGTLSCDCNPPTRCQEGDEYGVSGTCPGADNVQIQVSIQCDIFN